ncbi:MAG: hypothetical protein OEY89_18150, partial [Gammaproteobacteria bacterium]|nr:hypothetical protein [Gammaproteobacteria bacterium]
MLFTRSPDENFADALLKKGLTGVWLKLNARFIDELNQAFKLWLTKERHNIRSPELAFIEFMLFK